MTEQRSSDMPQIAVDANIIPNDSIDCGIARLRWCRGQYCIKHARLVNFLLALVGAGTFLGAAMSYFRISVQFIALEYGWNSDITEFLIASSGVFQSIFAIVYTYWALKLHPTSWLGGTLMIQAMIVVIAMIPAITNVSEGVGIFYKPSSPSLCPNIMLASQISESVNKGIMWGQLVLLFVLQCFLSISLMSYITVGLSYLDDNSSSANSPAAIAAALAALLFGNQVGGTFIMILYQYNVKWWLGWIILALLVFLHGFILSLFPRRLPKTIVHQAAQRIVEETRSRQFGSQLSTYMDDPDLWPSLLRLLRNKVLMFQIVSLTFLLSGYWNYVNQEESYLRSRFLIGLSDHDGWLQEWHANYIVLFLRFPAMAIGMLLIGLLVSKFKFTARRLVFISMFLIFTKAMVYVSFVFDSCHIGPIAGVVNGKLLQPFCSNQCICSNTAFLPICPQNSTLTYFSPCFAGCSKSTSINNVAFYEDCSCGNSIDYKLQQSSRATEGACQSDQCAISVIFFQVGILGIAFTMGIIFVMKLLVIIRSVLPQDKGLALALGITISAFISYVPINILYASVSSLSCAVWSANGLTCLLLQSPQHGNILNILTSALSILAILLDIYVFVKVKALNMYNIKARDNNYTPSLYTLLPHEEQELPTAMTTVPEPTINPTTIPATPSTRTSTAASIRPARPVALKPPRPDITVFRNASSVTNASNTSDNSNQSVVESGVKYAQVVFPPDKYKADDGSSSPKRLVVRANVPVQHLTDDDVRTQLQNLKSFQTQQKQKPTRNEDMVYMKDTIQRTLSTETNL